MGSFFGNWFRKGPKEDYEQVLELLALDIQKRQTHLSEIRLRERRTTLLFSLYALATWAAYVGLWYTNIIPSLSGHPRYSNFEKSVQAIPVLLGPIVILFIRRIVQEWYRRIGRAEEKQLVALRKQQKEKIEEIKKQTNYDSTRNLIERYDEANGVDSPMRRRIPSQSNPATPQRGPMPQPQPQVVRSPHTPAQPVQPGMMIPPGLQQQLSPSPQRPIPPPRKQWYDKLADTILGDDDTITAASSRYALICQKCFTHNGLVKESMWEDTQYVCPKCGHFNPSARALRQARGGSPPNHAASPLQPKALAPPLEKPVGVESGPNLDRRSSSPNRKAEGLDGEDVFMSEPTS